MSTPEARALALFGGRRAEVASPADKARALFAGGNVARRPIEEEEEDDGRSDILQAGAGVIEGIVDPLSIIPFIDRRLQLLRDYRGSETAGRIGYGVGAIGSLLLPYAPANLALRAGSAAARGLKLVKAVESAEQVATLANKMVQLSRAGEFVQGAVSGGLISGGMHVDEDESRVVQALQGAAFGGIADVAMTPIWRAISGAWKASRSVPKGLQQLAQKALETGAKDNAPVVVSDDIAELIGRSLTLADNVLGEAVDIESKTEMGLNIAKSLRSVEQGQLRVIPSVGRNHKEFIAALKSQGLDVIEATEGVSGVKNSSFLVGAEGTLTKNLAEEFEHYGFVKGQSVVVPNKGKGTLLGLGEKPGTVKVLFPGQKVKEVAREDMLMLPIGYTKSVRKSIGTASKLWGEFDEGYAGTFASEVLANEAQQLGLTTNTLVNRPARLSFDGAFEKFAADKNITGAEREALKDYFVRRQGESIAKFAPEEMEILNGLRRANKDMHPEGSLVEMAGARGYKVVKVKHDGKMIYAVRDVESGQTLPIGKKSAAEKFLKEHQRDLQNGLEGSALPVSEDLLNVGGVASSMDEAGLENMLSPDTVEKMMNRSSLGRNSGFIPREGYLRAVEDIATKNGESFPVYTGIFDKLARANAKWRNARAPYLNDMFKVVGRSWNRNIRRNMHEEWVQLVEADPKEWYAHTAKEVTPGRAARTERRILPGKAVNARVDEEVLPGRDYDEIIERRVPKKQSEKPSSGGYEGGVLSQADIDLLLSGGLSKAKPAPTAEDFEIVKEVIKRRGPDSTIWKLVVDDGVAKEFTSKADADEALAQLMKAAKPVSREVEVAPATKEIVNSVQRRGLIEELGLNDKEVEAAKGVRKLLDKVWENEAVTKEIGLTQEEYLNFYWPRIREFTREAEKGETFSDYLARAAMEKNMAVSDKTLKFFNDLHRTGQLTEYESDPLVTLTRYINGITFKRHAAQDYDEAIDTFKILREKYKDDENLAPHLVVANDYIKMMQGQLPEQAGTISNVFQTFATKLGLDKHVDEGTMDKVASIYVGLNHGAFMAFRLAKSVINFTQLGHVYMKDGAEYMAKGLKNAVTKTGRDEAAKEGAFILQSMRLPYEDQIMQQIGENKLKGATSLIGKTVDAGLEVSEIGGRLFSKADDFLRTTAYHSQKSRAIDAWNKYQRLDRDEVFEEAAGLTAMGEAVTQGYFKVLRDEGNEAAAKWLGVRSANDTQWMYQTGAGPIAFSRGAMKLFGQYGTWPVWYANFLKRGLSVGTKKDRIKFALRGAAFSGSLIGAGYATGVNTVRWHGPTSMFFAGGPMWEKAKDISTIWGGIGRPEGPPLDARMALAKYGFKYDEDSLARLSLDDPMKLAKNTIGLVTPGKAAMEDVGQAMESSAEGGSLYRNLMIGLGFDMEDEDND